MMYVSFLTLNVILVYDIYPVHYSKFFFIRQRYEINDNLPVL